MEYPLAKPLTCGKMSPAIKEQVFRNGENTTRRSAPLPHERSRNKLEENALNYGLGIIKGHFSGQLEHRK